MEGATPPLPPPVCVWTRMMGTGAIQEQKPPGQLAGDLPDLHTACGEHKQHPLRLSPGLFLILV